MSLPDQIVEPPAFEWLQMFVRFVRLNPWLADDDDLIRRVFFAYMDFARPLPCADDVRGILAVAAEGALR